MEHLRGDTRIVNGTSVNKKMTSLTKEGSNNFIDSETEFKVKIVKETNNSVTLQWNLISDADVYDIEIHHKVKGWHNVVWTSKSLATVSHLEENFGYLLRVKALKLDAAAGMYRTSLISPHIVGCTLAVEPTTICLFRAIKKNQKMLVKRILRRRPNLIEYPGPNGDLPLSNAIAFSEMYIIDMLLSYGAVISIGNTDNHRTPLHHAFYYGRLPVARMLLNRKANLEAKDIYGLTPSHLAVDANQGEILKFAIENGANMEAKDACGWTVLMRAVFMDSDLSIIRLLIMCGANMENRDLNDLDCQDLAHLYEHEKAAEYFNNICTLKLEKQFKEQMQLADKGC